MTHVVELTCHPWTPITAVQRIHVEVTRAPVGRLHLRFALAGDVGRLRVPPFRAARPGADLWRHTCFEAFIAADDATAYHELNLAPSGEWAVLAFRGYRDPAPLAPTIAAPLTTVRTTPASLELDAVVALDGWSAAYGAGPLRLALATVVEETSGACAYWAAHHPPGDPDFHHPEGFRLRLEPHADAC